MSTRTWHVDEVRQNRYMGEEYIQRRDLENETIFLFGNTLKEIAPMLILNCGDTVEITYDDKGFTENIIKK